MREINVTRKKLKMEGLTLTFVQYPKAWRDGKMESFGDLSHLSAVLIVTDNNMHIM